MRTQLARPRTRRRRSLGATAVEFALVAPVFFMSIFGAIDGGLLLFSANSLNNSIGLGMITNAQDGNGSSLTAPLTPDTDAVAVIKRQGFGASGFAKIDEVDFFRTTTDPSTGVVSADPTTDCTGGVVCRDRYDINGNLLNGVGGSTTVAPWSPGTRQTSLSNLTTAGITILAHYNYLAFNASRFNLSYTRYFRLEPTS